MISDVKKLTKLGGMNGRFIKDAIGWGAILWLIGYVLGFVFYAFVPPAQIGWFILPIGVIVTIWVLSKKIHSDRVMYFVAVGAVWALIAIALDWLFIVKALHPADGYYKTDIYGYYALTLLIPGAFGLFRSRPRSI